MAIEIGSFGGNGVTEFSIEAVQSWGLRAGARIDALLLNGSRHGGTGGNETTTRDFNSDEYIEPARGHVAWALAACTLIGSVCNDFGGAAQALTTSAVNRAGNLSVVSPAEGPPVANRPGVWVDVPGLATAVQSRAGDNLEITVSAETYTTGRVFLSAMVDGGSSAPGDVIFKQGGEDFDGTRSFTFIGKNVTAGKHLVQIRWYTEPGITARIRDRSLTVNSAAPAWGQSRLSVVAAETDWVNTTSRTFANVPNMSTSVTLGATRDVRITFSGHVQTTGARLRGMAVVDGVPGADVVLEDPGNLTRSGVRSYSFVKKGVGAGTHTVAIQWRLDGPGTGSVADRTLAVFSGPASGTGGGLLAKLVESAPTVVTSTAWVDLPNAGGTFTSADPSSVVEARFGGEVKTTGGRLFLRPVIDGGFASPGDVTFIATGNTWRTQTYSFVKKNLLPGSHTLKFQAAVDAGATASIGDRSVTAVFKRRSGMDFAQPYASLYPRQGTFPVVVICFDPGRPDQVVPSRQQIIDEYEGQDELSGAPRPDVHGHRMNIRDWFQEVSGGRWRPSSISYIGCNDGGWLRPPAGREGTWYWDTGNFGLMWQDAMKAADPQFDFHAFDRNRDNRISGDELVVSIIRPQNGSYATLRQTDVAVDGVATPLTVDVVDVYLSAVGDEWLRTVNVGMTAHEMSHDVFPGLGDMYATSTTRPGRYSLMDVHVGATHLDPFVKLKAGLLNPDVVELNSWSTRTVALPATTTTGEAIILYEPRKADKEYFIVENRWTGTSSGTLTFDAYLGPNGIVVWHMVPDPALMVSSPPPGISTTSTNWERLAIRRLAVLGVAGQAIDLNWANGTPAKVRVVAESGDAQTINVDLVKLP